MCVDLVYMSTEHFPIGTLAYLVSSLHIGLDLFPSVVLFLGLHIILICQKSMGASTLYYYINYLHPHIGPVFPYLPSPLPLDDNAAGEFKVEDILYSRLGCYGTEYLVKWLRISCFLSYVGTWCIFS